MNLISPGFEAEYVWPETDAQAVDESLCYHARMNQQAREQVDDAFVDANMEKLLHRMEGIFSPSKVVMKGWPENFEKFIIDSVDWNASPGWPWRQWAPTNRDLFGFDGIRCDPVKLMAVEQAVARRWMELEDHPESDPIFLFIKPEPHKISKRDKKSWRLISSVGLTDTLIDRILYGNWLDKMIEVVLEIPPKAGWTPQRGGYKWMSKVFRSFKPLSIDKSCWDWTVQKWHAQFLDSFIPRMVLFVNSEWEQVFHNRMKALFSAGHVHYKLSCGCVYEQLVDGIQKSGCLGTIGFNSVWQVADQLLATNFDDAIIFSLGDDTVEREPRIPIPLYIQNLRRVGAIVKEYDLGFPIKFGGHEFTETTCVPAYKSKHMFNLLYLDPKFAEETMTSYQFLYGFDPTVLPFIQRLTLEVAGPSTVLSKEYLNYWYTGNSG